MRLAKKKKWDTYPTGSGRMRSVVCTPKYVCMYVYVYITKSSSFGGFSEILGMTCEAPGSRTGNTDFSIARILADELPGADTEERKQHESPKCDSRRETRAGERTSERASGSEKRDASEETRRDASVVAERRRSGESTTDLTWLQYTRYRPPRLPRRSFTERQVKRRTGNHPRIPFSSSQLQMLEDKYKKSAYLSRNDVVEMSATLRLPQNKIKIWFQNRRARQKRESLNSTITAR